MNSSQAIDLLLGAFETHSPDGIKEGFASGVDPNGTIHGRSWMTEFLEMYYRSLDFSRCVQALIDAGVPGQSPVTMAVLLDDADLVRAEVAKNPQSLQECANLRCAFTPLQGGTLLHVAAEYGLVHSAKALIELGADVNARAAIDSDGLNGHTPIFHTVCQHRNHSLPVLELLLAHGAKVDVRLAGITWGKGFDWETVIFDATPLSYAQAGLLPQFQRKELDVYHTIQLLLNACNRSIPKNWNVPNRYLQT